jgi:hypothetical protein
MPLSRALGRLALAAAMAAPTFCVSSALAQPAPGDAVPALPQPAAPNPLVTSVENFWHFAKIAKYDQAAAEAQKILGSGAAPADMLKAFEQVTTDRGDNLFDWLFKWMNVEQMKDPTQQLVAKLKEGQAQRFKDPVWIKQQIDRLGVNERAYRAALDELRQSGEYAVPIMIDTLGSADQKNLHMATRRALVDMGRGVLNPLVAVMETKDNARLITVIGVLGDIGYDAAAPYIKRVYENPAPGMEEVKAAAARALAKLGYDNPASAKASDLFYDLAEKFYYGNVSIVPDPRYPEAAHIWYWDDGKGLMNKDVPTPIFNEIMSKRACEYALKLDPNRADAVSLWLAANNRREADLPEGKTDTTHEGPDAHFYNVALGTQYLNNVLNRAIKDRTTPVALKVVKSLQEIVGESNKFLGGEQEPIIDALQYPDRLVRFEAALTLAAALPQKNFMGQELVVPTLAEAVSNTGKPNVVLVSPDANAANGLKEALKDAVRAETGSTPESASEAAGRLASVDVIVVDSRNNPKTDEILSNARVKNSPKLVIVENKASPYAALSMSNMLINYIEAGTGPVTPDVLTPAIEKARARAGSAPLSDQISEQYAQRSAQALEKLAISRGQVLDVGVAASALIRGLEDSRIEIAKSSASVLGLVNMAQAQAALASKAVDDKTADDLKIACFKALAKSAKFFGNLLEPTTVDAIQKAVETGTNPQVRSSAAESQGALNLSPERAKNLIVQQSQVGK